MKHILLPIFKATGYLIIWCVLVPYLVIEKTVKGVAILFLCAWHGEFRRQWLRVLGQMHFIPCPLTWYMGWKIDNIKDYFLLKNWREML